MWATQYSGGAWVDPRPVEAGPCGYFNQKAGFAPKSGQSLTDWNAVQIGHHGTQVNRLEQLSCLL